MTLDPQSINPVDGGSIDTMTSESPRTGVHQPGACPTPLGGAEMADATCSVEGCDRPVHNMRGWCSMHYQRWRKHGDPGPARPLVVHSSPSDSFVTKYEVDPETACWAWLGYVDKAGYGQFHDGEKLVRPHRFSWEQVHGPIPDGLHIDHLCRNKRCVNPAHLEPVTQQENNRRQAATRTHCPWGHEYTDENTWRDFHGWRWCRTCDREGQRRRYAERKRQASA